jgi:hypothetical protein
VSIPGAALRGGGVVRDPTRGQGRLNSAAFLLVGADVVVRLGEVVAILEQRACEAAPTREFLGFCRRKGQTVDLSGGEPVKSAVVCRHRVFLSPFSSATLRRRIAAGGVV